MKKIKILAVQDPAVSVYVDSRLDLLRKFPKKDVEKIKQKAKLTHWLILLL